MTLVNKEIENHEQKLAMYRALNDLSPRERQILVMRMVLMGRMN